jgi:hypothetical protein
MDGRSHNGRRRKALVQLYAGQLGGIARLTPVQLDAVRRAATTAALLEDVQRRALNGERRAKPSEVVKLGNLLSRQLRDLGIRPAKAKPAPKPAPQPHSDDVGDLRGDALLRYVKVTYGPSAGAERLVTFSRKVRRHD